MSVSAGSSLNAIEKDSINIDRLSSIYDFFLDVEDGPLKGYWSGSFSYDNSLIKRRGLEETGIQAFQLKVGQRDFDGRGAASVLLEEGDLIGLNWRESWEFSRTQGEFITRFLELWNIFDLRFVCTREVRRECLKTGELVDFLEDESSYGLVRYQKRQAIADFRTRHHGRASY